MDEGASPLPVDAPPQPTRRDHHAAPTAPSVALFPYSHDLHGAQAWTGAHRTRRTGAPLSGRASLPHDARPRRDRIARRRHFRARGTGRARRAARGTLRYLANALRRPSGYLAVPEPVPLAGNWRRSQAPSSTPCGELVSAPCSTTGRPLRPRPVVLAAPLASAYMCADERGPTLQCGLSLVVVPRARPAAGVRLPSTHAPLPPAPRWLAGARGRATATPQARGTLASQRALAAGHRRAGGAHALVPGLPASRERGQPSERRPHRARVPRRRALRRGEPDHSLQVVQLAEGHAPRLTLVGTQVGTDPADPRRYASAGRRTG